MRACDVEITGFSATEIDLIVDSRTVDGKLDEQPQLIRKEVPGIESGDL